MRILLTVLLSMSAVLPLRSGWNLITDTEERRRTQVLEAEARLTSSIQRRDVEAIDALLDGEARVVGVRGELLDEARVLSSVRDGSLPGGAAIAQPDVRLYDTVALVHGPGVLPGGKRVYVLRGWVRVSDRWQLAMEHTTDITKHATSDPPSFAMLPAPIHPRPADTAPPNQADAADVAQALRDSHVRYWAKDVEGYRRTIGTDLIRSAETGVRPGSELVEFMRDSPHLPRSPSQQLEMWTRVFGNVAIGGWLDAGTTALGAASRNRFSIAVVWRDGRWQIVQIQSTGVAG